MFSGIFRIYNRSKKYNYQELKANLSYPFRTTSDTEVLTACVEANGIEGTIKACNGMFAFVAYDTVSRKLFLCRDRLGIKPLYYYMCEDYLIFSSEIKGILNSGLVNAMLDVAAVDDYMAYRYVREPYTFFEGIRQVEAGTYLEISSDFRMRQQRY